MRDDNKQEIEVTHELGCSFMALAIVAVFLWLTR